MARPGLTGHVVSHTHWDRAWYLPFEVFRVRLVLLVKKLLDLMEKDTSFKFSLDGQTLPVEDYLAIHPEDRPRLEKLIREKRLTVGPFYCLPDQYLITGESLIRNCAIGIRQAKALGRVEMEGALSDVFGHPSQIPQILSGFGIPSAIFVRGLTAEEKRKGWVQRWYAPDGKSSVMMYFLPGRGYASLYYWGMDSFDPEEYPNLPNDADEWSVDKAERHLDEAVDTFLAGGMTTSQLWLGNGVDHHEAQPHAPALIRELNRRQDRIHLVHSTVSEMMEAVRAEKRRLPKTTGQFRLGLHGTMTSRVYLKQAYARIAGRLEMLAEPLLACADVYGAGRRAFRERGHNAYTLNPGQNWASFRHYPGGVLEYLWKLLLSNSPHDDICGCSVDATHQDMENRFKRASEICEYLLNDALLVIGSRLTEEMPDSRVPAIVDFNPHPFPWSDRTRVKVFLEGVRDASALRVVDSRGKSVPFAVEDAKAALRHPWDGNDWQKEGVKGIEVTLSFLAAMKPLSFGTHFIRLDSGKALAAKPKDRKLPSARKAGDSVVVENKYYKVTVQPNGTCDLFDRKMGKRFAGLGLLEDVEDVGDSYTYMRFEKPGRPVTAKNVRGRARLVSHDDISTTVETALRLRLPEGLNADRTARSARTSSCPVTVRIEIPHYRKGISLAVTVDNRAKDHELFVTFPTGLEANEFHYDSKFDFDSYAVGEPVARIDSTAIVGSGTKAVGVVTECPTLVGSRRERGGNVTLSLSVVRAVGLVNHTIPVDVWPAREAQCLRRISRTFEVTTGRLDEVRKRCLRVRRAVNASVTALPITPWERLRYRDRRYTDLEVPAGPAVDIHGTDVHLSAWKRSDDGSGWIVRVYSLAARPQTCRISSALPVREAHLCDLNETPVKLLRGTGQGGYALRIWPKEIETVLLRLDKRALASHTARKT